MRRLLNSPPDAPESPLMRLQFIRGYNPHNVSITMKTAQIYLLVIAALVWVSYSIKQDYRKQQQQEAQVHKLYCNEYPNSSSCKSN